MVKHEFPPSHSFLFALLLFPFFFYCLINNKIS